MFEIRTTDPARLKRITAAGGAALVLGLFMIGFNLLVPLVAGAGYGASNIAFGLFGVLVVVLATYPTYQAVLRLEAD